VVGRRNACEKWLTGERYLLQRIILERSDKIPISSQGVWKRSTEWMRTSPDFRSNPIGTFFDPEKVYQAYASGQSFVELQPAVRAGKFLPESIPSIGLPISVNTGPSAIGRAAD
jgi:hypothetical protein